MSYQLNKTPREKNTATWKICQLLSMCAGRLLSMKLIKVTLSRRWGWHTVLYLALGVMDCKCGLKHRTKNEQWKCQGKNTENQGILRDRSKTARKKGEPSLYESDPEQCIMGLNESVNTSWRLIFIHSLCVQWLNAHRGESKRLWSRVEGEGSPFLYPHIRGTQGLGSLFSSCRAKVALEQTRIPLPSIKNIIHHYISVRGRFQTWEFLVLASA